MTEILQAVLLGAVQALTEFLPISSSAHLLILPALFEWRHFGLFFDVALHYGTALAVLAYFRRDWMNLLGTALRPGRWRTPEGGRNLRLLGLLAAGSLPIAVVGLSARHWIEDSLRRPPLAATLLAVFALVLLAADRLGRQERSLESARLGDGLWVGLLQVLALVPGVSRSGITIAAARLRGYGRQEAARFSFLLSTPAILGATLLETVHFAQSPAAGRPDPALLMTGALVAALAGFACIHYFIRYLRTGTLLPFVVYRILLAAVFWWSVGTI